ncbi:MAG: CDP-diacylglycerol--glycerol-3-phosphate 3-phosphatidyltransferase [Mahellales bacterium]|jgi:CDP-diacylglycerol--glycerol-3-phosphate 3-phosphatidyltransferase
MNLANKITTLRILLIPVFLIFLMGNLPLGQYIAAIIFIVAASTDSLDGYIARKRNQVTTIGKFLDPLADKLFITSALISLVGLGKISAIIAIIIVSREFIITGFRVIAASEGIVIAASWWGKVKTITQIVAIVAILADNYPFNLIGFPFGDIMIIVAVIFTIVSGIDYIYKNKNVIM